MWTDALIYENSLKKIHKKHPGEVEKLQGRVKMNF